MLQEPQIQTETVKITNKKNYTFGP